MVSIQLEKAVRWALVAKGGWWLVTALAVRTVSYRPDYDYTRLSGERSVSWLTEWWYSAANFDGIHYLAIALQGYADEARFLPFFSLIIRGLTWPVAVLVPGWSLTGGVLAGQLIAWTALVGGLWLLTRLLPDHGRWSWGVLLLFPASFFLGAVYSESLFLCLTLAGLWSAQQRRFGWALGWASLAMVTRIPGVFVWLTVVGMWLLDDVADHQLTDWRQVLVRLRGSWSRLTGQWWLVVGAGLAWVPLAIYIYFNAQVWGSPWYFIMAHGLLANARETASIVWPWITGYRYGTILFYIPWWYYEWWQALAELVVTVGVGGALVRWSLQPSRYKLPLSWLLFCWWVFLLPFCSGTWSGMPRYVLPIVPFLTPLVSGIAERAPVLVKGLAVAGVVVGALWLTLFTRGYFVA